MAPKRGMPKRGIPKVSIQAIHLTMANLQLGLRPVRQVSAESIARTESILGCPTVSVGTRGCALLASVHAEDGTQNLTKVSAEVSDRTSRKQVQFQSHNKERLSDCVFWRSSPTRMVLAQASATTLASRPFTVFSFRMPFCDKAMMAAR